MSYYGVLSWTNEPEERSFKLNKDAAKNKNGNKKKDNKS